MINYEWKRIKNSGDIIDLKFANEIINDQRKIIKELKKENGELKMIIEQDEFAKEEGYKW